MNIKKCMNGHFFDVDKYQLCPHCGAGVEGGNGQAKQDSNDGKKEHRGLFGHKKKNKEDVNNMQAQQPVGNIPVQNVQNMQNIQPVSPVNNGANAGAGLKPVVVFCPSCHAQLDSTCKFCIKCGFKIEPAQNNDRVKTSATTTPTVGFSQHSVQKPVQQAAAQVAQQVAQNTQPAAQNVQPVQNKPVQQAAAQAAQQAAAQVAQQVAAQNAQPAAQSVQPVQNKPVQQAAAQLAQQVAAQNAQASAQSVQTVQNKPVQQAAAQVAQQAAAQQVAQNTQSAAQNVQSVQNKPVQQAAAQLVGQNMQPQVQPAEAENLNNAQSTISNIAEAAASSDNGQMDLQAAIRSAVSGSEGRTVGFFSMDIANKSKESEADTAAAATDAADESSPAKEPVETQRVPVSMMNEPVVGWLVCVGGVSFGESFSLYAGRNSIGRSVNNRVIIAKDNTVSRDKHAWIIYEPKKRVFYAQPGEASGLTYLEKEILLDTKQINPKDILEIGKGKYMLVPLCGPDFSWEDYLK